MPKVPQWAKRFWHFFRKRYIKYEVFFLGTVYLHYSKSFFFVLLFKNKNLIRVL